MDAVEENHSFLVAPHMPVVIRHVCFLNFPSCTKDQKNTSGEFINLIFIHLFLLICTSVQNFAFSINQRCRRSSKVVKTPSDHIQRFVFPSVQPNRVRAERQYTHTCRHEACTRRTRPDTLAFSLFIHFNAPVSTSEAESEGEGTQGLATGLTAPNGSEKSPVFII